MQEEKPRGIGIPEIAAGTVAGAAGAAGMIYANLDHVEDALQQKVKAAMDAFRAKVPKPDATFIQENGKEAFDDAIKSWGKQAEAAVHEAVPGIKGSQSFWRAPITAFSEMGAAKKAGVVGVAVGAALVGGYLVNRFMGTGQESEPEKPSFVQRENYRRLDQQLQAREQDGAIQR